MDNAPRTLIEAIRYFSDLDVATEFFAKVRWPDGPTCPRCECKEYSYLKSRRLWKCRDCKYQYSVKKGSVFEDSPIGLDKWLPAVWLIANCKNGISSYELARDLGVDHAERYVDGRVHVNGLENYWSLLKRTIKGTYVAVEPDHLDRYLDEQVFRFNERHGDDSGRFTEVLGQAIGRRITWAELTSAKAAQSRRSVSSSESTN